jgi:hypothetical protein
MIQQISYIELMSNNDITKHIQNGFGEDGLGAIIITDVPNMDKRRLSLLKLVKEMGELPQDILKNYERPDINYSLGWSRGKEMLKENINDDIKGSFYVDPDNEENNNWPVKDLKYNCLGMSEIMYNVGYRVLLGCDKYLESIIKNYECNLAKNLNKTKGRLLHYYENESKDNSKDNACSWHLDHGGLTVLTKSLYLDKYYKEQIENDLDGLYIKDRMGVTHHVKIPENSLLCQVGEILQILSGGYLKATPHCVSMSNGKMTRETYPLFIDCDNSFNILKKDWYKDDYLNNEGIDDIKGITPLYKRYEGCKTYEDFVSKTLNTYYFK